MNHDTKHTQATEPAHEGDERPLYERPQVTKKRSVSRATLFTGAGASVQGIIAAGPPPG